MNKGWKEAFQAFGILVLLGLVAVWLSGCVPMRAFAEYEHHSSAQDYYDLNTSDMLGLCMEAVLSRDPSPYSPRAQACLMWEVTGVPVYGRDPVGTLRLQQPIWIKP